MMAIAPEFTELNARRTWLRMTADLDAVEHNLAAAGSALPEGSPARAFIEAARARQVEVRKYVDSMCEAALVEARKRGL